MLRHVDELPLHAADLCHPPTTSALPSNKTNLPRPSRGWPHKLLTLRLPSAGCPALLLTAVVHGLPFVRLCQMAKDGTAPTDQGTREQRRQLRGYIAATLWARWGGRRGSWRGRRRKAKNNDLLAFQQRRKGVDAIKRSSSLRSSEVKNGR